MTGNDCALVLHAGEQLSRRAVNCPTGEYAVLHQHDGNVVLYRNADAVPVWATNTVFQPDVRDLLRRGVGEGVGLGAACDPPGRLLLAEDGDLLVLSAAGERLWSSGTAGTGSTSLMIHDWGKLVLKNDRGLVQWQTPRAPRRWDGWNAVPDGRRLRRGQALRGQTLTSDNGRYAFVHTADGAAYLCHHGGPVLWAARTEPGYGLELTLEGSLISRGLDGMARPGNSIGAPPGLNAAEFSVSDDGHLTATDDNGRILWALPPYPSGPGDHKDQAGEGIPPTPRRPDERLRTNCTPVIRTDFSDDELWRRVCAEIVMCHDFDGEPVRASVDFVDFPDLAGQTAEELRRIIPDDACYAIALVVDSVTFSDPEHPVLVVELDDQRAAMLRAIPHTLQGLENHVSLLGNMSWDDFAGQVDEDGVLRWDTLWGFPAGRPAD